MSGGVRAMSRRSAADVSPVLMPTPIDGGGWPRRWAARPMPTRGAFRFRSTSCASAFMGGTEFAYYHNQQGMHPAVTATNVTLPVDGAPTVVREPLSAGGLTAVVHLYRAEVGRMTSYRQRLDTTTNWSITSSALVTTFSLGNQTIPHAAFLFLMFINVFFLVVEARRFWVYEAARYRVLLLEHYFYPEVMGEGSPRDWRRALIEALRTPYSYPPVGMLGAVGWRLRRNYLWIYAAVL